MSPKHMGPPTGLAKQFTDYLRDRIAENGWTLDYLQSMTGLSRNYISIRMQEKNTFTVKDFETFAKLLRLDPQELLARVQFPLAHDYEGRLVPRYGVTVDSNGMEIYRTEDADPPLRSNVTSIEKKRNVRRHADDEQAVANKKSKDRGEGDNDT